MKKGVQKDMMTDDLYKPLPGHESGYLGDKLQKNWKQELKKAKINNRAPSLLKAILKTFGLMYFMCIVLSIFDFCVLRIIQSILLGRLLEFFREESQMSKTDAYISASGIIICTGLSMLLSHMDGFIFQHIGMKIRVACCSITYRKALCLNRASLSQTTAGQIVNLLSNDVARFDRSLLFLHFLLVGPIQTVIVMYFIWVHGGYAVLACVGTILSMIILQVWIGTINTKLRKKSARNTDERVRLMDEIISGIRVIKMYTWERLFAKVVSLARSLELKTIRASSYIRSINMSYSMYAIQGEICATVVAYVLLGHTINPQKLFVITALITNLGISMCNLFPQAVYLVGEVLVAIKRIQHFLLHEENMQNRIEDIIKSKHDIEPLKLGVTMRNASAKWNVTSNTTLSDINLEAFPGKLVSIIGPVGSGKSTLLHAILGELPLTKGSVEVNGRVSYAAQEPWLFSASVQQNILFGSPLDLERYERVVEVCALKKDFQHFPYGDQTIVGERGISLSGGQKARVNLARAVYRDADIYLFDDPLSALDTVVGRQLFESCISLFLRYKTCILVTHQLQYLKNADHIIIMCNGSIQAQGDYNDLLQSGLDFAQLLTQDEEKEEETMKHETLECSTSLTPVSVQAGFATMLNILHNMVLTKVISEVKSWLAHLGLGQLITEVKQEDKPTGVAEHQEKGSIDSMVYKGYIKAVGNFFYIFLAAFLFIFAQMCRSATDYWMSYWANQQELQLTCRDAGQIYSTTYTMVCNTTSGNFTTLNGDVSMYIYVALVLTTVVSILTRSLYFSFICIRASKVLHDRMFNTIMRATLRFFDTNPSGRILNRFSKDMGSVDEHLPQVLLDSIQVVLLTVGTLVVIIIANYWLIIPAILFCIVFWFLRIFYVPTSRSIKRLDGITRSPVFTHLNASIQGLTTIRAFGAQQMLSMEFDSHQNLHSSAWYMYLATSRAFGLWLDCVCVIYTAFVTLSFLVINRDFLGGNVGLAITQSIGLTGVLHWGISQSAEVENNMTSVERVLEYSRIEKEPPLETEIEKKPPSDWPGSGEITFNNVYLRYSKNDLPALKGVSFKIKPKEKVGIVGRTGAGKSSLTVALFQLAEVDGSIYIDKVDTKSLGLHDLRSKISIIPQDPVLFSGTLRKNLDPFDEYPDDILWRALEDVQLKDAASETDGGLLSVVQDGGRNFSVGQRQLLCLARAIVRSNKILILDEATANVDQQTDALIQVTIREKFADCTVLTIAHRLYTIMDSDRILVMDAGRVVEYDHPYNLLQNKNGCFHELVEQTGSTIAAQIHNSAKQNYHKKQDKPTDKIQH